MIIPWLRGILKSGQAPITWTLIILNFCFFLITLDTAAPGGVDFFSDQGKFDLTARLYFQFINPDSIKDPMPSKTEMFSLGMRALHDVKFINEADQIHFRGDQIAIQHWKEDLAHFREEFETRPNQIFGLSWSHREPLTWITYQFMHAGWVHLAGNMFMLLIFGAALEGQIGGTSLIFIYILSGISGAVGFLILGEPTLAPMIGASGSLSGIMAFYALYERKKCIPFFYFLSPIKGFYGYLWLPTWMIFPLFFVTDVASYFGTVSELGSGVAYTAHIGGMSFGLISGYLWKKWIPPLRIDNSQVLP